MSKPEILQINDHLPLVGIENLSKTFDVNGERIEALQDINISIEKKQFVCLLGPSGCGKSTLLRIIAGFESISTGAVNMNSTPVLGPGPDRGMVFQDYALFPWMSVKDNIEFGPKHAGLSKSEVNQISERFIDMVGLTSFANHYPHQLSGGMRQRVAIARVLANDSDLLLMDEPFGALDALTRAKLQEELVDIWQQTHLTIIFVTHSVEEAVLLADRVLIMSAGPGRIATDFSIDLPRVRDVSSAEFNEIRRDVTGRLTSNLAPTRVRENTAIA